MLAQFPDVAYYFFVHFILATKYLSYKDNIKFRKNQPTTEAGEDAIIHEIQNRDKTLIQQIFQVKKNEGYYT
jgi:hypothetical protein